MIGKQLQQLRLYMQQNDKGIGLIVVLWIAVILGSVASLGAYITRLEVRQSAYPVREIQLLNAVSAGVEIAKDILSHDKLALDAINEDWAKSFQEEIGDISVFVSITDEESKLNLNTAEKNMLQKFLPFQQGNKNELIDSLIDWRDTDSIVSGYGAENDYYRSLSPSSYCKNKRLDCLEELYLIKGFTTNEDVIESLKKFSTVYSYGKINVNTASFDVLMTLPGMDYASAQAIINRRNGNDVQSALDDMPFTDVLEVKDIVGIEMYEKMRKFITVSSSFFKIRALAEYGKQTKVVEAVLERKGTHAYTVLWREL